MTINLSEYSEPKPHRCRLLLWRIINYTLFRVLIGNKTKYLRNLLLRAFGTKIPLASLVYPSCTIYAPWNLYVGQHSCIGPSTRIYNKDKIRIGDNAVVSQGAFLCTASHDITDESHRLITAEIRIDDFAWVAADAFVGMGVTVGQGAVVGARAAVFRDVDPWTVVGGNPAKFIKKRTIKNFRDNLI